VQCFLPAITACTNYLFYKNSSRVVESVDNSAGVIQAPVGNPPGLSIGRHYPQPDIICS